MGQYRGRMVDNSVLTGLFYLKKETEGSVVRNFKTGALSNVVRTVAIFIQYAVTENTFNNFQGYCYQPTYRQSHQTYALFRTYEKSHTVVHNLGKEKSSP
jgi:hypothetical protein